MVRYKYYCMKTFSFKREDKLKQKLEEVIRQNRFDTSFRIDQKVKRYDSFTDPHSSYYFSSTPARRQLKHLRKAVVNEPNRGRREEMINMINFRIRKTKEQDHLTSRFFSREDQNIFDFRKLTRSSAFSLQTLYQKINERQMERHLQNKSKDNSYYAASSSEVMKNRKQVQTLRELPLQKIKIAYENPEVASNERRGRGEKVATEPSNRAETIRKHLHKTKHLKWMNFLSKRKEEYLERGGE